MRARADDARFGTRPVRHKSWRSVRERKKGEEDGQLS